ncbi:MAG TPA: dephospho-CoA kinase [Acidimicrobiales bacterium]|nr:dephospho-CoA kinase [Acidimicrobiales bacterium]
MRRIAVAGGIGAGKSEVGARLRAHGYEVVDSDQVAHEVTEPGTPAHAALRDAFGDAILGDDGAIDRAFLADVVFSDPTALRRLNDITHPRIGAELLSRLAAAQGEAAFVALPLFRPEHRAQLGLASAWAVMVEPETAVHRLVEGRGMSESDARARLASQMSNDERAAIVDRVLWNEGSLEDLGREVDEALAAEGLARG